MTIPSPPAGSQQAAVEAALVVLKSMGQVVVAVAGQGGCGGEAGEGLAAAAPGSGGQSFGGAAGVFFLPGGPGAGR